MASRTISYSCPLGRGHRIAGDLGVVVRRRPDGTWFEMQAGCCDRRVFAFLPKGGRRPMVVKSIPGGA